MSFSRLIANRNGQTKSLNDAYSIAPSTTIQEELDALPAETAGIDNASTAVVYNSTSEDWEKVPLSSITAPVDIQAELDSLPAETAGISAATPLAAFNSTSNDWEQVPVSSISSFITPTPWQDGADAVTFARIGTTAAVIGAGDVAVLGEVTGANGLAIGSTAEAAAQATAIGYGAQSTFTENTSVGALSLGQAASATAIGHAARARERAIAVGPYANADEQRTTVVGTYSHARPGCNESVLVGYDSLIGANSPGAVAIGSFVNCDGLDSVAIGYQSAVLDKIEAIAVGPYTIGNEDYSFSCPQFTAIRRDIGIANTATPYNLVLRNAWQRRMAVCDLTVMAYSNLINGEYKAWTFKDIFWKTNNTLSTFLALGFGTKNVVASTPGTANFDANLTSTAGQLILQVTTGAAILEQYIFVAILQERISYTGL